jgi:MYXO-CTERM domain-containing protein
VAYETRGNGLCSAAPGARTSVFAGAALLALLGGLIRRRRAR